MCVKAENWFILESSSLIKRWELTHGTGKVLGTLTDGAFEEHLSDKSNTIHQDLQRHCGAANESEFHAVVWDFGLGCHVKTRRRGPCVQRACRHHIPHWGDGSNRAQCFSMWRNGHSRAQVQATLR